MARTQVRFYRGWSRGGRACNCQEIKRQSMVEGSADRSRAGRALDDFDPRTRRPRGQLDVGLEIQNRAHRTPPHGLFR